MKKLYPKLRTGVFLLYYLGLTLSAFSFQGNSGNAKPENQDNPCNSSSKYLYWTGEEDDDFFNENNWRETNQKPTPPGQATESNPICLPGENKKPYTICPNVPNLANDKKPNQGTLDPGKPIDFNLIMSDAQAVADGTITFACAEKGLTLANTSLDAGRISQGVVTLDGESTLKSGGKILSSTVVFNFLDAASWIYLKEVNPQELQSQLGQIHVNHAAGTLGGNFRTRQYYQKGTVIRPLDATFSPLQVYSGLAFLDAPAALAEDVIHRGAAIPTGCKKR